MIAEYCAKALEKADCRKLEDGSWAEIPGFAAVWASASTVEHCRTELLGVLEEWLLLKLKDGDSIPEVDGYKIEISKIAVV
ncbi:MAG: hypothetical protein RBS57_11580 [Desulforhabdus sp.]|jgi:predicted RNase H-like HicB family nuclease|nr:hypothetical protein [Desulforhabdus sp.]